MQLKVIMKTDTIRDGAFISLRCLARSIGVKAGRLRDIIKNRKDWCVPFYFSNDNIYLERRIVAAFFKADVIVIASGIERLSDKYSQALRLTLVEMNLWTTDQRQILEKYKQTTVIVGYKKVKVNVNPSFPLPEEGGPTLFDEVEPTHDTMPLDEDDGTDEFPDEDARNPILTIPSYVKTLLRYCKMLRPPEARDDSKLRKKLMVSQYRNGDVFPHCTFCKQPLEVDATGDYRLQNDHHFGYERATTTVIGCPTNAMLKKAAEELWRLDNMSVLHAKCNVKKHTHSNQMRKAKKSAA